MELLSKARTRAALIIALIIIATPIAYEIFANATTIVQYFVLPSNSAGGGNTVIITNAPIFKDANGAISLSFGNGLTLNGNELVATGGGGGGTPAGPNKAIQFNSNGAFGASNALTWNGLANQIVINSTGTLTGLSNPSGPLYIRALTNIDSYAMETLGFTSAHGGILFYAQNSIGCGEIGGNIGTGDVELLGGGGNQEILLDNCANSIVLSSTTPDNTNGTNIAIDGQNDAFDVGATTYNFNTSPESFDSGPYIHINGVPTASVTESVSYQVTGNYIGNGASTHSITGLGFRPTAITVYRAIAEGASDESATKTNKDGAYSEVVSAAQGLGTYEQGDIISLDSGGFTVGDNGQYSGFNFNGNGYSYTYIASETCTNTFDQGLLMSTTCPT